MAKKVLIAEDYADTRSFMKFLVESYGYQTLEAIDGKEAVEKVRREHPDLILMDVMMPRLSGLEAARKIHEIASLNTVPIVAISAFRNPLVENTNTSTFRWHAYLTKPVNTDELEMVIANLTN